MTQAPGRAYPQTGVAAFTTRQRSAVDGADGATPLDQLTGEQTSAVLGAPIPIVFCNRINGVGGVWIDPPATFARFENDDSDTLEVSYHLVISDGELGGLSCVWQGTEKRAGPGAVVTPERPLASVEWQYGQRAGSWAPGVFINQNWKYATQVNTQDVKGTAIANEDDIEDAKARVQLTSKSDYVTRYEFTAKMIDWGNRVQAFGPPPGSDPSNTGTLSPASTFDDATKPLRNLGDWTFERERSTDMQRIELEHEEDVYWNDQFIPEATYRCTILEESIEPGRVYEIPSYIGDDRGSYQGMSTLSFVDIYPLGNDTWKQPVHVFIEDGVQVPPLLGGPEVEASSNLLPDLVHYLMVRRGRPAELIDTEALTDSAQFNQANGLLFNGIVAVPTNLRDYLFRIAPFYLLRVSNRGGAVGLRPAVPTDENGAISLAPVSPVLTLTEDHIIPASFRQELIGLEERRPFVAAGLWREQPLDEIGIPRITEVRRADTPDDAPVEQFDMTEFCVTEEHAVKALIYQLSRRAHITHRLSVDVKPEPPIAALATGDILRVRYQRMVAGPGGGVALHDFFYELDEVETSDVGAVTLQLTHYPVTDLQESIYAAEVIRGFESREGFAWSDAPAEYGNNTLDPGEGATEDLDEYKDPPIPFGGAATFSEPTGTYDPEDGTTLVKVCMDKPTQTQDMTLRLVSELVAFNNQMINIPVGQQCGEVKVPSTGTESGTVGILGYTGGGWVNPDLTDTFELGTGAMGVAAVLWTETEDYNDDGQLASRTVTVKNAAGTDSVTFTYDLPTYSVPVNAWFDGGNGLSIVQDGNYTTGGSCSGSSGPTPGEVAEMVFPIQTRKYEAFSVDANETSETFALPVNNESCIFVYRRKGANLWWHYQHERVYTFTVDPSWIADATAYCALGPYTPGTAPDGVDWTGWVVDHVDTTLSVNGSTTPGTWDELHCVLVSPTSVREITPPAELVVLLNNYTVTSYPTSSQQIGSYLPSGYTIPAGSGNPITYSWGAGPPGNDLVNFLQPINALRFTTEAAPVASYLALYGQLPLLTHYGIGALATDSHASAGFATFYSPAVFTFLDDITPAILDDYDGDINAYQDAKYADNIQYAYIESTYLGSAPAPTTFLAPCVLSGSCPVGSVEGINWDDLASSSVRFDQTTVSPVNIETAMSSGDFTAGSVTIPLVDIAGDENIAYAWDWGQPSYCRAQLLALGFSEDDLTP